MVARQPQVLTQTLTSMSEAALVEEYGLEGRQGVSSVKRAESSMLLGYDTWGQ